MRAERPPIAVIAAELAGARIFVVLVSADYDHWDDACIIERVETVCVASSRISDEFAKLELGQAVAEIGKVVGQDTSLVGVGRVGRGVSHPGGMQFIVTEHLGIAAAAVDVPRARGILLAFLVGAAVVDQASERVARGSITAALGTLLFGA
jgi:hypothetical protein